MRAVTFLLTFTVVFCGASIAGSTDRVPDTGPFVFDRAPVVIASR
jgi:hypothetical protein